MNVKIRKSVTVFLLIAASLSTISCIPHIRGNGKVVSQDRNLSGFDAIKVSSGIELVMNQDNTEKVVVEADENIQPILKTEVRGSELRIYMEESILHAKKMKVYVTLKQLKSLHASSGSEAKSTGPINSDELRIDASSGSEVHMEVVCKSISLSSSSGSELNVSGTTQSVYAESSSGSDLKASHLIAEKGNVTSSSGAELTINITKDVQAHASSGAEITVLGNPASRNSDSSSGGEVHFR
ncbi:MAG: DUF2807 domain-containing protein [Marinilabiliales bacterium]|nr:DUF2807 domain-containing protein [Marinilabiliales bacterium]